MAEGTGPMALLLKSAAARLKVWGLLLNAQMLQFAHLEDEGLDYMLLSGSKFYYAIKYKWFGFTCSNQDICLNTLSLISVCVPPPPFSSFS